MSANDTQPEHILVNCFTWKWKYLYNVYIRFELERNRYCVYATRVNFHRVAFSMNLKLLYLHFLTLLRLTRYIYWFFFINDKCFIIIIFSFRLTPGISIDTHSNKVIITPNHKFSKTIYINMLLYFIFANRKARNKMNLIMKKKNSDTNLIWSKHAYKAKNNIS